MVVKSCPQPFQKLSEVTVVELTPELLAGWFMQANPIGLLPARMDPTTGQIQILSFDEPVAPRPS